MCSCSVRSAARRSRPGAPAPRRWDAPWCTAEVSGAFVVAVVCDNDEVDHVAATLGDGSDLLIAQPLARVGGHLPGDDAADGPAVIADLGAGDDTFVGSPLAETVYDGPGADDVQGYAPAGGGHDVLVQPDVANPAIEDADDKLDTDYVAGIVDYSARTTGGVVVSARDWVQNDGAPGENDRVTAYGVRGTSSADTITAAITGEEFIAFDFAGEGGDDVLQGGAGADRLDGGDGNDELTGDIGADLVSGGAGDDRIHENDGDPENAVTCGSGADVVQADPAGVDDDIEPAGAAGAGCETVTRAALAPLETAITSQLPPATNDATPTVSFISSEPRAGFECSLDGSPYVGCGSPITAAPALADGSHELLVRAVWGTRKDPTPAKVTTIVDTVAPETTVLPPAPPSGGAIAKTWSSTRRSHVPVPGRRGRLGRLHDLAGRRRDRRGRPRARGPGGRRRHERRRDPGVDDVQHAAAETDGLDHRRPRGRLPRPGPHLHRRDGAGDCRRPGAGAGLGRRRRRLRRRLRNDADDRVRDARAEDRARQGDGRGAARRSRSGRSRSTTARPPVRPRAPRRPSRPPSRSCWAARIRTAKPSCSRSSGSRPTVR